MNSEIRDAGQEGTKEPNIVLYKINDSHEYKEIARFRGERITNGGGIVTNRGFKLTGLAHHHEIFRNVDITGVYIKEDGLHIYVTNSMVPVSAPVLPQHELLPSIHSEGSWGCRCGITVSFAHDRESAIESFNEHMAAAPVPERTNEATRKAIEAAYEWAAKFPLSTNSYAPDNEAANHVHALCEAALAAPVPEPEQFPELAILRLCKCEHGWESHEPGRCKKSLCRCEEFRPEAPPEAPAKPKWANFDEWWRLDGKYFDPDFDDVSWEVKLPQLAEYAWNRAMELARLGLSGSDTK